MKSLKALFCGIVIIGSQAYAQGAKTNLSETTKGSLEGVALSHCGLRVGAILAVLFKSDDPERNAARWRHMISYGMFGPFGSFGVIVVDECTRKNNVTK